MIKTKGQVAIFVVVALVIIGVIAVFATVRNSTSLGGIPKELTPVFSYYQDCIEADTRDALALAGLQGGRIDVGDYQPGNERAPFGSDLFFSGARVPYWFNLKGNGLIEEKVPTKSEIEAEVETYVAQQLEGCDFSSFYEQGYSIEKAQPNVAVSISNDRVDVSVQNQVRVSQNDVVATKENFDSRIASQFGNLYDQAKTIYAKEKEASFLEQYSVDVLRSYAPVDGVEVQCAPKIWKTPDVVSGIKEALEANIAEISFDKDTRFEGYYAVDIGAESSARVLYDKRWPSRVEITPADEQLMVAEPVGTQEGLGVMGFCYVPYHFVYDVSYPALVQLYDNDELFQFPVVVIIDKNVPRQTLQGNATEESDIDLCSFKQGQVHVQAYDTSLNPVRADISYKCFDQLCPLGSTDLTNGLDAAIPLCVNGQLVARAEGYADSEKVFSSNNESRTEIILDKEYTVDVTIKVDGRPLEGTAIAHFTGAKGSESVLLPNSNQIHLTEGAYNVSVFVYGNSSVILPESKRSECVKVARSGIGGLFGGKEEKCFDITTPASTIDYALRGGGNGETYILSSELAKGNVTLYVSGLPQPQSFEQLQTNFELFSELGVDMGFT